ncbi:MAG: adenosylcobinamide-GDP ribazoletransferase [Planctomycetota bacterium]
MGCIPPSPARKLQQLPGNERPDLKKLIKQEIRYLLTAVVFFTRIPLSGFANNDRLSMNQALKYFPLIGWLVGAICAWLFYFANLVFPPSLAVIIAISGGLLITGALHEDGLADCCDAFGGGWDKAQILTIMKDPRIGSYGATGLIISLLARVVLLTELAKLGPGLVMVALLTGHASSRYLVLILTSQLDYVRETADSKSASMVDGGFSISMLLYSSVLCLLPIWLIDDSILYTAVPMAAVAVIALGFYFKHRIGGYTGDCLGATQQLGELIFYFSLVAMWTSV